MLSRTEEGSDDKPDYWFVLVCGLPLAEDSLQVGDSLTLHRLQQPLSVFDLAAAGAVGFREWAVLEPLAPAATAEIVSATPAAGQPGYNTLNKGWLVSALLVLRGFARHVCPAASTYSWNLIAGHQERSTQGFRDQLAQEGARRAVFQPYTSLAPFKGGLLDYHLRVLLPKEVRDDPVDEAEARWLSEHFNAFNLMAAQDERFRFALEAAVDWRYAGDLRAGLARLWGGIEALFDVSSELVYRISLMSSTVLAPRSLARWDAFRRVKGLYATRSKAVHGEPLSADKLSEAVHGSFELLRALLLDAVERGSIRTLDDYERELLT